MWLCDISWGVKPNSYVFDLRSSLLWSLSNRFPPLRSINTPNTADLEHFKNVKLLILNMPMNSAAALTRADNDIYIDWVVTFLQNMGCLRKPFIFPTWSSAWCPLHSVLLKNFSDVHAGLCSAWRVVHIFLIHTGAHIQIKPFYSSTVGREAPWSC